MQETRSTILFASKAAKIINHAYRNDISDESSLLEKYKREIASELYSTSGDYDLLMKVYIDDGVDIGKFVSENIANVPGIRRSLTTLTFKAF